MIDALQSARSTGLPASSRGFRRSDPYGDTRALRAARARRAAEARRDWERVLLEMASASGRERMSERWREVRERLRELEDSLKPLEDELERLRLLPPRKLSQDALAKPAEEPEAAGADELASSLTPGAAFAVLEFRAELYRIAGEQADGLLALRQALRRQGQRQRLEELRVAVAASHAVYPMPAASAAISLLA